VAFFKKHSASIYKIFFRVGLVALAIVALFFVLFLNSVLLKKNIELTPLGTVTCQFDPFSNQQEAGPFVFHRFTSVTNYLSIEDYAEFVAFAQTFDFIRYDLVASFGYDIEKMYRAGESYHGRFIPYFLVDSEYHKNVVYIYSVLKNTHMADVLDTPFSNPVKYT